MPSLIKKKKTEPATGELSFRHCMEVIRRFGEQTPVEVDERQALQFLEQQYWERTMPRTAMRTPSHWKRERCSRPMTSATRAVATHIIARKTLDLPTPNFLIAMAHREKARLEQRTARQRIGSRTSQETSLASKFSMPLVRKNGRKYTVPIRNWYITMT